MLGREVAKSARREVFLIGLFGLVGHVIGLQEAAVLDDEENYESVGNAEERSV